ncbi:exo-beta-N-acetylmuramidase NamZ domain-containing protein [Desulfolucanica intricata]|uniref:exo-beta-N-acetylmuramidase NamZ domain-containing protein n=1 Tax=Desulfolucanica intricata TaxID=1285191 RepID=UPI00082BF461|nr:exo-beta-N-acetylmuramidase NamZ domain-containing protein [Desulfolucanica intricata]
MVKRIFFVGILLAGILLLQTGFAAVEVPRVKLGNEVLMSKYHYLIEGKKIGLVTNQSGVTSRGESIIDVLANDRSTRLTALFGPEHGIDGTAKAGEYVESYTHEKLGIPVYSLYGATRMPTEAMLRNLDVLIFDVQDIGARSYTYMSTLNYCMVAAQKYNKTIIVLDRPNPLGGEIVEGPVLEDPYITFVGVDNLPMAHGMTAGELAQFFNRKIGADLKVVPMEGYTRNMIYQDTGLPWVQTSPNIPDLDSVFGYMATGLGEGTGIFQADKFKWIGGKGIDSDKFAGLLNQAGLNGVTFIPEDRGEAGGVRLNIYDPHVFNPAKAGIYALAYAHSLNNFAVPKSGQTVVMFDKIMGSDKIGQYLEQGLTPQQIEAKYTPALNKFKEERKQYLIYGQEANNRQISVIVNDNPIEFDSEPYIDAHDRLMVPLRAIVEALGAKIYWNDKTRVVTVEKEDKTICFTIDSTTAIVDGEPKNMDTSPVIKNSRTMLPVRYVSEYLGYKVNWNQYTRTVTID